MPFNLNDHDVQKLLQRNAVETHYSMHCLPPRLIEPTTDKASKCLYEIIDPNIYENEARMVAFRTIHSRLQAWIKALNLYFYEYLGKKSDKIVEWSDNSQTIFD